MCAYQQETIYRNFMQISEHSHTLKNTMYKGNTSSYAYILFVRCTNEQKKTIMTQWSKKNVVMELNCWEKSALR